MSDYAKSYSNVVRYDKVSDSTVREFFSKYEETKDPHVLAVLADKLDDYGDGRSIIIRRHLHQNEHPLGIDWKKEFHSDPDRFFEKTGSAYEGHALENGSNVYYFVPTKARGWFVKKPKAVVVSWSHSFVPEKNRTGPATLMRGNHTHLTGTFTPEEARQIADSLEPENATKIHNFLDTLFGKANANQS